MRTFMPLLFAALAALSCASANAEVYKWVDKNGNDALSATTGFVQVCATSFYTTDSGNTYWDFNPESAGACTAVANSNFPAPRAGLDGGRMMDFSVGFRF